MYVEKRSKFRLQITLSIFKLLIQQSLVFEFLKEFYFMQKVAIHFEFNNS